MNQKDELADNRVRALGQFGFDLPQGAVFRDGGDGEFLLKFLKATWKAALQKCDPVVIGFLLKL